MQSDTVARFRSRLPVILLVVCAVAVAIGVSIDLMAGGKQDEPDLNVTVTEFLPQGKTDRHTNITVRFSRDMVSSDSLDRPSPSPLIFDPPLAGIARWIDRDILRFYPDEGLAPATKYTVRVESDRTYSYGNKINDGRTFKFDTPMLGVDMGRIQYIPDPDVPGSSRMLVNLRFTDDVELGELAEKLTITGGENAVKPKLSYDVTGTATHLTDMHARDSLAEYAYAVTITTEPFKITEVRQQYFLTIADGLKCYQCGEGLPEAYKTELQVRARRRQIISEIRPGVRGTQGYLQIATNAALDPQKAASYIHIRPPVDFTVELRYRQLALYGPFAPGAYYTVTIDSGIPDMNGAPLEESFSTRVQIPDAPPTVKFVSRGIYLPRDGAKLLEIETVNIDKLSVEIDRVFANNLVYALSSPGRNLQSPYPQDLTALGEKFFYKDVDLEHTPNTALRTTIDVGGIIGDTAQGIYRIAARSREGRWSYDSRLVMLTDIGIVARLSDNYLMVWVNSLSETSPIKNADVRLFSRNNQELLSGKTDSRGVAIFNDIEDALTGFDPMVITAEHDGDLSYLNLSDSRLSTSDFDVKGRPYKENGYDAFVYLDRGVYRPGDTAHIVSLVRNTDGTRPPDFPYFVIVKDPSGREFMSFRVSTDTKEAMNAIDVAIPDYASTGKYSLIARIGKDYEIGRETFQVEDFMPDRIKVTVATNKDSYLPGETVQADVTGTYLFGPPASNNKVSGHVTIEAYDFKPEGWSEYSFSDNERSFSRMESDLPDTILDAQGKYTYLYAIPETFAPPSALEGVIAAGVSEAGGRAVYDYEDIIINPYPRYIGVRLDFDGYVKPGDSCRMSLIALDHGGQPVAADSVVVTLYRVIYNTVLQRDDRGLYRYKSEKTLNKADSAIVDVPPTGGVVAFVPREYGRYLVMAHDPDGNHSASRYFYSSGWGYAPWSMEHPDRIQIDLDRDVYAPDEIAHVQIRAPFGGALLLTVEKDRVYEFIRVDMPDNTADLTLPIKQDYFPNAYITATIIKKAADVKAAGPARAFGIAPLMISTENRRLPIAITAPDVIKPRTDVTVNVSVGKRGVSRLTLAAVDAGILQLTDYATPGVIDFYYGKKQPILAPYDIYSFIYPEIERAASHLSPSGGLLRETGIRRHLNPIAVRRVKSVALWSGIVQTDEDGNASVKFAVPEFNGKLTLTAVAVRDNMFGSASEDMIVRDNIIIQESFPRFVTPNDAVDGLVTIYNNTGATADITVRLDARGSLDMISPNEVTVTVPNNAQKQVVFTFRAGLKPGKLSFTVTATDGREQAEINFDLPNRPGQPLVSRFGFGSLTEDDEVSFDLPDEWIEGTTQTVLETSSLAAVTYSKNINYLVRYPYGCLEQTTSGLFPLLYFNDLARFVEPEVFGTQGPEYFIREGIIKLTGLSESDGWFHVWPNTHYINSWTSIYASHFLLEAKVAGYYVDPDLYKRIVGSLKDIARGKKHGLQEIGYPEQIYAAYALSRAGIVENGIVNELRKIPTDDLPPYARYMMAAVLYASGDQATAVTYLPQTILPAVFEPETGGRLSSGVRTNAILLSVLTDIQPDHPGAPVLVKSLMDGARTGRWYTTQATAWALMALGKYLAGQERPDFTGDMTVVGDTAYAFDTAGIKIIRTDLTSGRVRLNITGPGRCYYYWQINGVPTGHAPAEYTRGISIRREYTDADGQPLDMNNVPLGTQVICRIHAEAVDNDLENVVISDLLPAGLEIENPRLKSTPRLSWLPKAPAEITYQDIRDDRLLLFTDLRAGKPIDYYYSLRAISSGIFIVPPIAADCMYNPPIAGASSSGMMTVTKQQ